MEDLRFALDAARQAEKAAKDAGRNALTVKVCRRSGEHSSATLSWKQTAMLNHLVGDFVSGTSDRWTYHLRRDLPSLAGALALDSPLPWSAVVGEVGRLLGRLERLSTEAREAFTKVVLGVLDDYHTERRNRSAAQSLEGFVTLCQSASFLARGGTSDAQEKVQAGQEMRLVVGQGRFAGNHSPVHL